MTAPRITTVHVYERRFLPTAEGKRRVEVWPKCSCGAQVCQTGYGRKAAYFYRVSSNAEWVATETDCTRSLAGKPEQDAP